MCDDRERLIGYVYGESEPDERATIESHLAECDDCRREIRALRSVRQDLLAWDVPAHESVWRPMPAPKPRPVWQVMPAWAMLAAASLILVAGAAGGAATYAFLPRGESPAAQVAAAPAPVAAQPARLDVNALSTLERRVSALEQTSSHMAVTLNAVSARTTSDARVPATSLADLRREVTLLNRRQDQIFDAMTGMYNETVGIRRAQSVAEKNNNWLLTSLSQQGSPQGFAGVGGR